MQRILFCLFLFFKLHASDFQGFVSLAVVDTFTGKVQKIFLETGKNLFDDQKMFKIKVNSIEADEETQGVAWVDIAIYYKSSKKDVPVCVQMGKLSTSQIYRTLDNRYLIGFYILPYTGDGSV